MRLTVEISFRGGHFNLNSVHLIVNDNGNHDGDDDAEDDNDDNDKDYDYAVRPFLLACLSGGSAVNTCISQTTVKVSS